MWPDLRSQIYHEILDVLPIRMRLWVKSRPIWFKSLFEVYVPCGEIVPRIYMTKSSVPQIDDFDNPQRCRKQATHFYLVKSNSSSAHYSHPFTARCRKHRPLDAYAQETHRMVSRKEYLIAEIMES